MINLSEYSKLLRISDSRGYLFTAIFGFLLAEGFSFPLKDIFIFFAIVILLSGFAFSINDCFDQEEDRLDQTKKNPLISKKIGRGNALVFSFILAGLGLFLAAFFGGFVVFLFCLIQALLIFFYSSPPLRLKSRAPLDLISHGLFGGAFILFFPFLFFKTQPTLFHYLIIFSSFLFSIILELRNEYEDYESDKSAGLKTSVCVFGYQFSEKLLRYLAIFYSLSLLPVFYLLFIISPSNLAFLLFFSILTFIFLFLFLIFKNHKLVKNYKLLDGYNILAYLLILAAVL